LVPTTATGGGNVKGGTAFGPDFFQLSREIAEKLVAKSGSDSASEFELLAFVKADEQFAKMFSGAFRLGISADDDFCSRSSLILIHAPVRFPGSYLEPLRLPIKPYNSERYITTQLVEKMVSYAKAKNGLLQCVAGRNAGNDGYCNGPATATVRLPIP